MLTSAHSIVHYDHGQAFPDRLTRNAHQHYVAYADRMLAAYRQSIGRTRRDLHRAVQAIFANEPDCHRRRIASFCKLLDDAGKFDEDRKGKAAALRLRVFAAAAKYHPLVTEPDGMFERSEHEVKALIAAEIGKPWAEIDAAMYTDVLDRQPLLEFDGFPNAEALLSRYNLAQLQACLYKAQRMSVKASSDFAAIVRYAKLSRLLVETSRIADGVYRIDLSGPASVLHETRRYGVNFARFVSALVACRGWEMSADVATPWGWTAKLQLSSKSGYRSHVPSPAEFDSEVEQRLAEKWGESCGGWRLIRDAGILQQGQVTFVPDFLLKHDDGREAWLEIVGFWTPEYLESKRKTLAAFSGRRIVLAVSERTATRSSGGPGLVLYKSKIDPNDVVAAVEQLEDARQPG